jgi:hypothetical protein
MACLHSSDRARLARQKKIIDKIMNGRKKEQQGTSLSNAVTVGDSVITFDEFGKSDQKRRRLETLHSGTTRNGPIIPAGIFRKAVIEALRPMALQNTGFR